MEVRFTYIILFTFGFLGLLHAQEQPAAIVMSNNTLVEIENSRKKVVVNTRIMILNANGDKYGLVEIPYSLANPVRDLEALVTDMSGKVMKRLKRSSIERRSYISSISLYDDYQLLSFHLNGDRYPYVLEYSYQLNFSEFLSVAHWEPDAFNIPNNGSRLEVRLPHGYRVNVNQQNISAPTVTDKEKYISWVWEHESTKSIKRQTLAPHRDELVSRVRMSPVNFKYGVTGRLENWSTFGQWQDELNKGLNVLPVEEVNAVQSLISQHTDSVEMIKALYHYMQDKTRYINVSIDIGGLKPYPASYVSEKGYGDCKALTNYMKSLLDEIGVRSYYVKLYAGDEHVPIDPDYIGHQSNHVVLCIPTSTDTLWLENTDKLNPFDYAGTFIQNRKGLLVDGLNSRLVDLPTLTQGDVKEDWNFTYTISANGQIDVVANARLKGDQFERFKIIDGYWTQSEKEEYMQYQLPHLNYELLDWKVEKGSRDDTEIRIDYSLHLKNALEKYANFSIHSVEKLSIPQFEKPDQRTQPISINYPINQKANYHYELGSFSHSKISIGNEADITSDFGHYSLKQSVDENGNFQLEKKFLLREGVVILEDYNKFYDFMSKIYIAEERLKIMLEL